MIKSYNKNHSLVLVEIKMSPMEAGERIEAGEAFRTPLSIFDVIRLQKLNNDKPCLLCREEDSIENSLQKKEETDEDFFFPLSLLF